MLIVPWALSPTLLFHASGSETSAAAQALCQGTELRAECFARMVEDIMYMTIGFLLGCLLTIIPLVHRRAVRLTRREVESSLPLSLAEFQADKDQLRAEFAMSTRRLEMNAQQLKDKTVSLLVHLSQKSDAINRLKTDRDILKTAVMDLKIQIGALQKQLTGVNNRTDARHVVRQMSPRRMFH